MGKSLIQKKFGAQKVFGPAEEPVKYSSVPTRYSSLHGLMCGAEIEEINQNAVPMPGEVPNNWWGMNIRSGVNETDCPMQTGKTRRGIDKIAGMTFDPANVGAGWIRKKGEPGGWVK